MADSDDTPPAPRHQSTSLSLGERLRSARKARALSIEQMADALRLEESSVQALEEGRFEDLGAPVFVRGHLKRYAAIVGLGTEAVLDAYRAAAPGSDAPPEISRPRAHVETVAIPTWAWWLLGAVVLVAVLLVFGGREPAPEATSTEAAPAAGQALPEPPAAPEAASGAATTEPAPAAQAPGTVVTELPVPLPAAPGAGPAPQAAEPAPADAND